MSLYAAINARLDAKIAMQAELDSLRQQLATLQSQPRLQPVTPEAMAELEGRHAVSVLVASEYGARTLNYSQQGYWWRDDWGVHHPVERPTRGYFIELAKLKEVQQ